MSLARYLAPLANGRVGWLETLFVPLLAVGLGLWLHPLDPFFTHASFPWGLLGPLLIALRYGPLAGISAMAVTFLAWLGMSELQLVAPALPKLYFLGGLITVMLCGEFASLWHQRVRAANAMQHYLGQRLESLTRQHYLLRLSHDRLEQDLINRPVSMRDALTNLRRLAAESIGQAALPSGSGLLKLLSQYCQIERAALVPLADGRLDAADASWLGQPFALDADDALLRFSAERDGLCHVAMDALDQRDASAYLIVAPLKDMAGGRHGLLVVESMPFFALHEDTLQMLNLLLGYYADSLASGEIARPVLQAEPRCPPEFAFELQRLWHIRQDSGIRSAIIGLMFTPQPGQEDLPLLIRRQQRTLDVTWLLTDDNRTVLLTLMPLAAPAAVEGYLARIEEWLHQQRGLDLADAGVASHIFQLDSADPVALLATILQGCHVAPQARTVSATA